jgi:hypothetical protein
MASPELKKRLVAQVFEQVERQLAELQKDEAARLHNAFVGAVESMHPSSENLLLVLEILKQEVLGNMIDRFAEVKQASSQIAPEPEQPK